MLFRSRSHRSPVRSGDLLDPVDPDRIIDMAELVDVLGERGEGKGVAVHLSERRFLPPIVSRSGILGWLG